MQDLNPDEPKLIARLRQTYRVAAIGLALGMSMAEAAAHAHISETDLNRYMRDGRFQAMLDEFNKEIEGRMVERVTRKRVRVIAKAQIHAEEALDVALGIMRTSMQDNVRWNIAKALIKQVGVDLDNVMQGDELKKPEVLLEQQDPSFLKRLNETEAELAAWDEQKQLSASNA